MADKSLLDLTDMNWRREIKGEEYTISTSRKRLDIEFINDTLASEDVPWGRRLSIEVLEKMLDHSIVLGVFKTSPSVRGARSASEPSSPRTPSPTLEDTSTDDSKQIGMARLITDHVTFAYLTDVYIAPAYRRYGLARWLMTCTKEVIEKHPAIRRSSCVTSLAYGSEFYKETLDMYNIAEEAPLVGLTKSYLRKH